MPKPTYEEVLVLFRELRELSRVQTKCLEDAGYLGKDSIDEVEFDKRRHRIQQICGMVANYKPPQ